MIPQRFTYPSPGFSVYWQEETGKELLKLIPTLPSEEEILAYSQLYMQSDEVTDRIIEEVFEKEGHRKAHNWLNIAIQKGIIATEDAPQIFKDLFLELETPPVWLDQNRLEIGAAFCRRTGNMGAVVLRNYCLMGGYESSAINKPLIFTGALEKGAAKRMSETFDFWVNVTGEGAMKPFEIGYRSSVHLRFIHGLVRYYTQKKPGWKNELWGLPINQGDMVATYLGFSLVFLQGLKKLGFQATAQEIDGLFHLWKYIGYLIGIPPILLPDNEPQAVISLYKWTMAQPEADEDTVKLALSLVDEPLYASFPEKLWQKRLQVQLHVAFNYFLLGESSCKRISLPKTSFHFVPPIFRKVISLKEHWVHSGNWAYQSAVSSGRKQQERTRFLFLKWHEKK